jgi:hypothetical protein
MLDQATTPTTRAAGSRRGTTPAALTLAAGMLGFFMITIDVSAVNAGCCNARPSAAVVSIC